MRRQNVMRWLWFGTLVVAGGAFLMRDVPHYAQYTPASFGEYWAKRGALIPHVLFAGPAFVIGFLQFSRRLRARRPRVHRTLGLIYVCGSLIGAPAAMVLGARSSCALCRPPLVLLGVLWLATTVLAYFAARRRDFTLHRAFMVRSFALMNVFTLIRLVEGISFQGVSADQQRIIWEWSCMIIIVLGTEIGLTWWPAFRRIRRATALTGRTG
jgi:uncharacterized membrane protein